MTLKSLSPEDAIEEYLKSREHDASKSTLQNHRYRLKQFRLWTDEQDFEDMNEMTGRKAEQFKNWRISSCDINAVTLENHLRTFRVFIRWCESVEAVEQGVADKIIVPRVSKDKKVREQYIERERAENLIDYLCRFHWASQSHIIFHTLWHCGMRRGALYALDKDDWDSSERYLCVRHRPDTGTPLKLQEEGERNITVTDDRLAQALDDYIQENRFEVSGKHGRRPLLTSQNGRLHSTSIQHHVYKVTRPCWFGEDCPHDRDTEQCEAMTADSYSKCPSSVSPHPVRRGAITAHLNGNVPKEIASERMSVSVDTLVQHYDARTLEDRRLNRKDYLENI